MKNCLFCDFVDDEMGSVIFENELCVCIEQRDDVLKGWCMIIPKRHCENPFEMTDAEWVSMKQLMDKAKEHLDIKFRPDGYNVGWNIGAVGGQHIFHAHMHILARYKDEPLAGRGFRYFIRESASKRPLAKH